MSHFESVLSALSHANQRDPGYGEVIAGGDLGQMGAQYQFLKNKGFDVGRSDVYPALRTVEDRKKAIAAIWEARVAGWWNLRFDLLKLEICTQGEYETALACERG